MVRVTAVQDIYAHKPLTSKLVKLLNAEATLEDLAADLQEIGYSGNG